MRPLALFALMVSLLTPVLAEGPTGTPPGNDDSPVIYMVSVRMLQASPESAGVKAKIKVLAEPILQTVANRECICFTGGEVPIPGTQNPIERAKYGTGVTGKFVPAEPGKVRADLEISYSSLTDVPRGTLQIDKQSTRMIRTLELDKMVRLEVSTVPNRWVEVTVSERK